MNQFFSNFVDNTKKDDFNLQYLCLGLSGEIGEVCNEVKKIQRDDNNILSSERKFKIIDELSDVFWYYTAILNKLDVPLESIISHNINKIKSK